VYIGKHNIIGKVLPLKPLLNINFGPYWVIIHPTLDPIVNPNVIAYRSKFHLVNT
jgi:hypothetical protein